jgi:hypothetical protein
MVCISMELQKIGKNFFSLGDQGLPSFSYPCMLGREKVIIFSPKERAALKE